MIRERGDPGRDRVELVRRRHPLRIIVVKGVKSKTMRLVHLSGISSFTVSVTASNFSLVLGLLIVSTWASEPKDGGNSGGGVGGQLQMTVHRDSNNTSSSTAATGRLEQCENGRLTECWNQIPPFPDQGIPSSQTGVTTACRAFEKGMSCVQNWTKQCLRPEARQKIMESVRGAHETFAFLCQDPIFREEFLRHASCYKKITVHWDECANRFVSAVRSLRPIQYDNPANLCCVRRNFIRCVSEVSHHYCSKEASIFLLKMAETLVRTAMRGNTPQPRKCDTSAIIHECDRRNEGNCFGQHPRRDVMLLSLLLVLTYLSTYLIDFVTGCGLLAPMDWPDWSYT